MLSQQVRERTTTERDEHENPWAPRFDLITTPSSCASNALGGASIVW
jgi:hypothetical protein